MQISQPPGNNPSYYYRASPTLPQLSECFPETPCVLYMHYNIRVTHRNGAIKHIFYTNQIHGGISRLFFIHFVAPCAALHLVVKLLLQIFSVWRFELTLALHTSVGCISSRMPAGLHFVTQPILWKYSLIFDINHQQNTRRSDQIETIKTIMQTTRPRITWKVLPMAHF